MTKAISPKKASLKDWHWADVLAALRKAEWSLRQLGIFHGYADGNALGEAARRPFPKAERIIADALGIDPKDIWPTRYDAHGNPNRRRGPAPRRPKAEGAAELATDKATTATSDGNPQSRRAA